MKKNSLLAICAVMLVFVSCDPNNPNTPNHNEKTFSISSSKRVTFSPGNLQYNPAKNEWRFAENQLDYIGTANSNISNSYNGWIDLFGWGTGNNPTNSSEDYNNYQTFVDWGTNQIGDDAPNTWRTLTYDEWEYILNTRSNAYSLKGIAQVNGVNGLILLPDNWTCPNSITFKSGFHNNSGKEYYAAFQTFTIDQWAKLETAGAIFLPASGGRNSSNVYNVQDDGYYYSATGHNNYDAYGFYFYSFEARMGRDDREDGLSVRLVKDL